MAKKKTKSQSSSSGNTESKFEIINLRQKMFPVPYYAENGELRFLNLRLQKRRHGQKPPVLSIQAITPAMKKLEQRGHIKIQKI